MRALEAEESHLLEYIAYIRRPGTMLRVNFLAGLARGFGVAVGFSILGALLFYFLQYLAYRNLPVIGDFIAQVVEFVKLRIT